MSQVTVFKVEPLCPSCGRVMTCGPADDPAVLTATCFAEGCAQRGMRFVFMQPCIALLPIAQGVG